MAMSLIEHGAGRLPHALAKWQLTRGRGIANSARDYTFEFWSLLMLHRLTALLVIWLGLLGAAGAAPACPMIASGGDCCPHNAPMPCGDTAPEDPLQPASETCCIASPNSDHVVALSAGRLLQEHREGLFESPDSFVSFASFVADASTRHCIRSITSPQPRRPDAALIYLHTGRLRL